jgi:hypothetical protein
MQNQFWSDLTSQVNDALNPPANSDAGTVAPVTVVTDVVNNVVNVLTELSDTAREQLGIDENQLTIELETAEKRKALIGFLDDVKSLKQHEAKLQGLYEQFQRDILSQPFQVASQSSNMRLASDLYVATLRTNETLKLVFRQLKTLLRFFPDLEDVNPQYRSWADSV